MGAPTSLGLQTVAGFASWQNMHLLANKRVTSHLYYCLWIYPYTVVAVYAVEALK